MAVIQNTKNKSLFQIGKVINKQEMAKISIQICNFEPFPSIKQLNVLIENLGNSNNRF